jgi:predicted aconitase with swiveling domain
MNRHINTRVLFAGEAQGELLTLSEPLSFWGGVEPSSGRIIAAQHPQQGAHIGGRILALPATIGSSSSSSVLLELIRSGRQPAALILGHVDAILIVGCLVGRELRYVPPPVVELAADAIAHLRPGRYRLARTGELTPQA